LRADRIRIATFCVHMAQADAVPPLGAAVEVRAAGQAGVTMDGAWHGLPGRSSASLRALPREGMPSHRPSLTLETVSQIGGR
jgi:hypothetical protein